MSVSETVDFFSLSSMTFKKNIFFFLRICIPNYFFIFAIDTIIAINDIAPTPIDIPAVILSKLE